jgi:hypothetical protein
MLFLISDLYKKWEGKWLTGTNFDATDTLSDEDCAIFCNNQTLCLSFDYCPLTGSMQIEQKFEI